MRPRTVVVSFEWQTDARICDILAGIKKLHPDATQIEVRIAQPPAERRSVKRSRVGIIK